MANKGNPNHDPKNGEFTSGGGSGSRAKTSQEGISKVSTASKLTPLQKEAFNAIKEFRKNGYILDEDGNKITDQDAAMQGFSGKDVEAALNALDGKSTNQKMNEAIRGKVGVGQFVTFNHPKGGTAKGKITHMTNTHARILVNGSHVYVSKDKIKLK